MKALFGVLLVSICGCAASPQTIVSDPREAIATAVATCATAIERIASTKNGDAASKVAAVGAIERMCGSGGASMQATMVQQYQQPQSLGQTLWTAALQTADIMLRGYGIRASRDVSINAANNATATAIAGYSAFGNIASAGFNSNAAIASYIQAPPPNITTTTTTTNNTTLSGYGVIGSGSYVGPINRNCNGGQAGGGGNGAAATTGGQGGSGGGATGGSC